MYAFFHTIALKVRHVAPLEHIIRTLNQNKTDLFLSFFLNGVCLAQWRKMKDGPSYVMKRTTYT